MNYVRAFILRIFEEAAYAAWRAGHGVVFHGLSMGFERAAKEAEAQ